MTTKTADRPRSLGGAWPDKHVPGRGICMHALVPMRGDIRLVRQAPVLADGGYSVTVVDVEDRPAPTCEDITGNLRVRHVRVPSRLSSYRYGTAPVVPWLLYKVLRMALATIRVLRTPADVYHACDIAALPACYIASRLRRKPLVSEAYELPLADPSVTRRHALSIAATWVYRRILARCSGVVVSSPSHARELTRVYGITDVTVVRNIPIYRPPTRGDHLRNRLGLGANTRIALYQGGLQDDRGLDLLVLAARHLPPSVVVTILGDGPARPRLETLIRRESVPDRVRLLPPVPYADLLEWTASADLGLNVLPPDYSPSIRFCLPNKLFEYLMAGIPVLTSPLDSVVELITAYDVGAVVYSMKPHDIAQAIVGMLADPARLARMRAHALAACARDLRWDVERLRLLSLYQSILASDRA